MEGITGIVLAGGQGRRMGTVDKGLQLLHGRPMVAAVIARLAPQVDDIVINANQNRADYERFGHRVAPDSIGGFVGPLAGLLTGLSATDHELVLSVPCDSPFLPLDLAARLFASLEDNDLAIAKTGQQVHPVFALVRTSVIGHLTRFLEGGGRKIDAWYSTLHAVEVSFDDEADAFRNINTREELNQA